MAEDGAGGGLTQREVELRLERAKGGSSLKAARELFQGYRAACHASVGGEGLASGETGHQMLQGTLAQADEVLRGLVGVRRLRGDKPPKRWHKVEPLARSFFGNSISLLSDLADPDAQAFVLRRVAASADFLAASQHICRKFIRTAVRIWSEGQPTARVQAILLLRRLALYLPSDGMDDVLRRTYKAFAANAKRVNRHNMEHISFMTACLTELHGLDTEASYTHAFTGIRGLAQLLRNALVTKSKESLQAVYSWQFLSSCEVWERVVSKNGGMEKSSPLRHLIHPLSQVILGALRLLPSSRYAPLRLKLLRILQRLGSSTDSYLPVATSAADILGFNELSKKPMPSRNSKEADLMTALKVPKAELRASYFQEYVVNRSLAIIADHLEQWAYHPAFPELCHIPLKRLRSFVKTTPNSGFRRKAQSLITAAERTGEWVARRRDEANFAPRDWSAVDAFLADERAKSAAPLHKQSASIRDHVRQQELAMTASEVTVSAMGGSESQRVDQSDERNGDSVQPNFARKRSQKEAAVVAAEEAEEEGDEDAEEAMDGQRQIPEEGELQDLVLSEDEDEGNGEEAGDGDRQTQGLGEEDDVDYDEDVLGIPAQEADDAGPEKEGHDKSKDAARGGRKEKRTAPQAGKRKSDGKAGGGRGKSRGQKKQQKRR